MAKGLSPREMQIALLVCAGQSLKEIGAGLRISPLTAKTHLRNLMPKIGARSREQMVASIVAQSLAIQNARLAA